MWHLGTWFSGGVDSVRFAIRFDDLKGLFPLELFYNAKYLLDKWAVRLTENCLNCWT